MYKAFFGLNSNPFNISPDPSQLLLTRATREALACLMYGLHTRRGFVLLTGEVGTGKTTLLNLLLEQLHANQAATAFIFNPRMEVDEFFDFMLRDFGVTCDTDQRGKMLFQLNQWLLDRHHKGQNTVLVIDEAHNLSTELLEEIRLLTNLETSTEKLLQIVLSGQPELRWKLNQPQLRQLQQRITMRCKTLPLTAAETRDYIMQRLQNAGGNGATVFEPSAIGRIHLYSRGIPRLINAISEHALIAAFAEQTKPIKPSLIDSVADDLELGAWETQPGSQPVRQELEDPRPLARVVGQAVPQK